MRLRIVVGLRLEEEDDAAGGAPISRDDSRRLCCRERWGWVVPPPLDAGHVSQSRLKATRWPPYW
jgi:hypothetical protein